MKKKLRVCCCLVDYHFYITKTTRSLTLFTGKQKVSNLTTITVVKCDEIFRAYFDCIYNALLIRKTDEDIANELLNSSCQKYCYYSSYYKKIQNNAKNCFQVVKETFFATQPAGHRSIFISYFCTHCFKKIVLNLLVDEFYCIACHGRNLFLFDFGFFFLSWNYSFNCDIFNSKRKEITLRRQ